LGKAYTYLRHICGMLTVVWFIALALPGVFATTAPTRAPTAAPTSPCGATNITTANQTGCPCPDVFLDVPNLSVDQIYLEVDSLEAHVSLNAKVGNLVQLNAGVDVSINRVVLNITGVRAQLSLVVRLDNVREIVDDALEVVAVHPEILTDLIQAVEGLLSSTINTLGQTVQRLVLTTGDVVTQVLDSAGNVLNSNLVGNILNLGLQVVSNSTNTLGQTVETLRDTTGNLVQVILDDAGNILTTKVLNQK